MSDNKLERVLWDIKCGRPVILVDDYDRENEGDVVIAAEKATIDNIVFFMSKARGLMCVPCCGDILDNLEVPMMVKDSTDRHGTPFTVSVDAADGITTGMSAHDRLKTLSVFVDSESVPSDLARPGHLMPLRANDNLVAGRRGHTEGAVALVEMAELKPVAVIAEIINEDGTMAKGEQLDQFGREHNLNTISIEEIANARLV